MKIAIYTPYLDALGGGEKYMLTIAEYLSQNHEVDVLLDGHLRSLNMPEIIQKLSSLHNLNLHKVHFKKAPIGKDASIIMKSIFLRQYDWLFFNSDGSLFLSTAQNNVVHFQVPFDQLAISGPWGRMKLKSWKEAIYNSRFTQKVVEKNLSLPGRVVYPPVEVEQFKPADQKKKRILTTGRFVGFSKVKKQQLMIDIFKQFFQQYPVADWSFHLVGAVGEGDQQFLEELKVQAKGFPIFFYPNLPFEDLVRLYGESSIYWHAMGFGEDDPKKSEHFGISTVEAMASGTIPVVINKGGQPEIVQEGVSGFLWDTTEQWCSKTYKLIEEPLLFERMSKAAQQRAQQFSKQEFIKIIQEIIDGYP